MNNRTDHSAAGTFGGASLRHLALMLVAGAVHAFSIAAPLSFQLPFLNLFVAQGEPVWWVQLVSLGMLAGVLAQLSTCFQARPVRMTWRAGALSGGVFATSWLACTFWWTFIALHTYGGLPVALGVVSVIGLAVMLGMYYAVACGIFVVIASRLPYAAAVVFGALWTLAELARGVWFTGFGWGAAGYAHVDGPLSGYAAWVGAYGLCFLVAWMAMTLARLLAMLKSLRWRAVAGILSLLIVMGSLPVALENLHQPMTMTSGQIDVTLLQGNIPQDEKFEPGSGVSLALQWYSQQLQVSKTSLVIAPETAIPLLPQQLAPEYWSALLVRFSKGEQAALIGMPLGDFETGYTNSVVGLKPGQPHHWRYDKHHLVPFGEFIPPLFKWFTELMNIPLGDFKRGSLQQPTFDWQGQRLAPNICYENLFGEELGQLFKDPQRAPTIFVNVSNLAWFGNSVAMDQHLHIARMRALEFERPFVLATNTGVTAIVDHQGRVVSQIPRNTRGVLVGEVEGRQGVTPFAAWIARFGLWPYWLLAGGVVSLCGLGALRNRQESPSQAR